MDQARVHVLGKEKAEVICPSCGGSKDIILAETELSRNYEIKCICGNSILVVFEKRRSVRKRVLFAGTCFSKGDPTGGTTVKIVNLSKTGIRFLKEAGMKLELDETIRLRFRPKLANNAIRCAALVRNIDGNSIGAKFLYLDLNTQKLIGSCHH